MFERVNLEKESHTMLVQESIALGSTHIRVQPFNNNLHVAKLKLLRVCYGTSRRSNS